MDHTSTRRAESERLMPGIAVDASGGAQSDEGQAPEAVFSVADVTVTYGTHPAIRNVTMDIYRNEITALIGPSGCGKSTFIRCFNRMNDLIPDAKVHGKIAYHGQDLYAKGVDPVEVRRRIGMVFQKPNPFPKSIADNITFGPKVNGMDFDADEVIETSLRRAALWDEVKNKLNDSAYSLSGGQQQRLCIARAIAVDPDVILMDEPASALDPISTGRIEDLMRELQEQYTIVIVTHNMQQAARVSDYTAFMYLGELIEFDEAAKIFTTPSDQRTEDYVTGRFG